MLEVFTRPEHQDSTVMDELALLIGAALHDHYDTFDDFKVSHLGMTDSLEIVLPELLRKYRFKGIHASCESDYHELIVGANQTYPIHCLVFTEKNSDYLQYHLSYLCTYGETLFDTARVVTGLIERITGKSPEWIERSSVSYRCRYEIPT